MTHLIADSFVVLLVLSAWVALRFMPLVSRRARRREWDRAGLAAGVVVFHIGAALNDLWFYIARIERGTLFDYYSLHWSVLGFRLLMIVGCLVWMLTLDRKPRRRLPLLIVPIVVALAAAWVLP